MNRQIASGTLRDERVFQVERLTMEDLPQIIQLQSKVKNMLTSSDFLSPLSEEEYTSILTGNGFMVGVFVEGKMIAFRAMLKPELDEEHLGIDAGLSQEDLPQVIYSEISNVDPDYRGNGLQNYMGKLVMKEIDRHQFRYVCATVAPMNIPSIKDKFSLGLQIIALKEKYTGMLRYVFFKDLSASLMDNVYAEEHFVHIKEIEEQQTLIQSGFLGTGIKEYDGEWYIQYCK